MSSSASLSSGQRIRKTFYMYKRTIWVIVIWFIISKTLHMGEHLFHVFTLWSCLSSSPITDSTATMIRNKKNQWQNSTPPPPWPPHCLFFPAVITASFSKSLCWETPWQQLWRALDILTKHTCTEKAHKHTHAHTNTHTAATGATRVGESTHTSNPTHTHTHCPGAGLVIAGH